MPTPSLHGGDWTQLTISMANFHGLAHPPAGLGVLSMGNRDDKAIATLGEVFLSAIAHRAF